MNFPKCCQGHILHQNYRYTTISRTFLETVSFSFQIHSLFMLHLSKVFAFLTLFHRGKKNIREKNPNMFISF